MKTSEKQKHDLSGSALTLQYDGTGTATAALAAGTLTIARSNVNAFTLVYTGSAATCTAAIASNTLTIARAAEEAIEVKYAGEEEVATITIADNILTILIRDAPTVLDLTHSDYNTIAKVITTLDAIPDVSASLVTGAINTNTGISLDAIAETSIKTKQKLKYTPANLTWDLASGSYNTITKIIAALDALDLYTCTIAAGAVGTGAGTTMNNLAATSIKTQLILKSSPAAATYDLSTAPYDTLAELIAALDAVADLSCDAVTEYTSHPSAQLVTFEATNINNPITFEMDYSALTSNFLALGYPIGIRGWDTLALYVKVDINSSKDTRFKFLVKPTPADEDLFLIDHSKISCPNASLSAAKDYIELDSDADQSIEIVLPSIYGIDAIQIQISAGTVGVTAGKILSIEYVRTKGGG